jgi:hypothetical protein
MAGVSKPQIGSPPRLPKSGFLVISPAMMGSTSAMKFFERLEQATEEAQKIATSGPSGQPAFIVKVEDMFGGQG